jgi:hypothetical protein
MLTGASGWWWVPLTVAALFALTAAAADGLEAKRTSPLPVAVVPDAQVPVVAAQGVLQRVQVHRHRVVINGVGYQVAYDAGVAIRGSHSAFSLLRPGMKVRFSYLRHVTREPEIFGIEQLPDNTVLEET